MFQLERTAQLWGITGNLGGGKSLTAVQFAVDAMSQGYFVCSNISLKLDLIAAHYGEYTRKLYRHISLDDPLFDPFKLPCGSPRGSGGRKRVLVILDECAEWVDQYSSAKDPRIARLWSWLRHSSKRSQDIFIIVQRPDYLNKVIRILITRWIWVHDLAVWRVPVLKLRMPFMSGMVMRNIFDNLKNRIGAVSFASKSYWGQFYNTAECLNSDGATYCEEYEIPKVQHYGLFWLVLLLVFSQIALFRAISASSSSADLDPSYPDSSPPSILADSVSLFSDLLLFSASGLPSKASAFSSVLSVVEFTSAGIFSSYQFSRCEQAQTRSRMMAFPPLQSLCNLLSVLFLSHPPCAPVPFFGRLVARADVRLRAPRARTRLVYKTTLRTPWTA